MGYEQAADILMQAVADRRATPDAIVYPVCFMLRHLVELWLKNLIYLYARSIGDKESMKWLATSNHSLTALREKLKAVFERTGDDPSWLSKFDELFADLAEVDESGTAFRYHSRRNGTPQLVLRSGEPYCYLALDQLARRVKDLAALFDGADEILRQRGEYGADELDDVLERQEEQGRCL